MVDTFTGCTEGFPTSTEKAKDIMKTLLSYIIPQLGLPSTL
jgi:hypothetical protein